MKQITDWVRVGLFILCVIVSVGSLSSCVADADIGNNTELGEQFISCVISDHYDDAYALLKETVAVEDFDAYWGMIQSVAEGAVSYKMEQIGWKLNTDNGLTTRQTAYQVYLDNGRVALFQVATRDNIGGIAGLYFSDVTDFITYTDSFVPAVNVVLIVVSLLSIAFSVWMLMDCLRRRIKRKILWAFLILCGIAFTLTLGDSVGFRFMIGSVYQGSTIVADPGILAVQAKVVVPVGAIVYFCLRKKLALVSDSANGTSEVVELPAADSEAEDRDDPATDEGSGDQDARF